MMQRQLSQDVFAAVGEPQHNFAPVYGAGFPADKTSGFQPVRKFHGAVMMNLKALGKIANPRPRAFGEPLNCQEQLMLPRFQSGFVCRLLAEAQKAPDQMPEFR